MLIVDDFKLSPVELKYRLLLIVKRIPWVLLRNFPWATTVLVILSAVIYKFQLLHWTELSTFEQLLFHPIVHANDNHIVGNMALGIVVIGTLIESWMIRLKRIVRYGLLVYCYFASLIVAAIWRLVQGEVPEGSSGLIFAGLGVVTVYYLTFHDQLTLKGWSALGPVAFGISFAFLAERVLHAILDLTQVPSMILHLLVFFLSCFVLSVADDELSKECKTKMLQKG